MISSENSNGAGAVADELLSRPRGQACRALRANLPLGRGGDGKRTRWCSSLMPTVMRESEA